MKAKAIVLHNKKHLNAALECLKRSPVILRYDSLEEMIFREDIEKVSKELQFLSTLKKEILLKYRLRGKFIAPSLLDYCVYSYFHQRIFEKDSIDKYVEEIVKINGFDKPSMVLFPVHSMGIKQKNIFKKLSDVSDIDYIIISQTNNLQRSISRIQSIAEKWIGRRPKTDWSLLTHYYESRGLKWLHKNPLLFIKFTFSQWDRHDNMDVLIQKYQYISFRIFARSVICGHSSDVAISSKSMNNFETLDIKHFLTMHSRKKKIEIDCIPMLSRTVLVNDISNINTILDPDNVNNSEYIEIAGLIDKQFKTYISQDIMSRVGKGILPKHQKAHHAMIFFGKSFKASESSDAIIFLQTAFETLLIDSYTPKKRITILTRVSNILSGIAPSFESFTKSKLERLMNELIQKRNDIIHSGVKSSMDPNDFKDCQYIFLKCLKFYLKKVNYFNDSTEFMTKYMRNQFKEKIENDTDCKE